MFQQRPSLIEDMQRVVAPLQALLTVVAAKVDTLSADHVTRADMATLRKEMSDGFTVMDERFVRKDLGETRYSELREMDAKQEKRLEAIEALLGTSTSAASQRSTAINDRILNIAVGVGSGLFFALIGYILTHLTR